MPDDHWRCKGNMIFLKEPLNEIVSFSFDTCKYLENFWKRLICRDLIKKITNMFFKKIIQSS